MGNVLNQILSAQAAKQLQAQLYERNDKRLWYRMKSKLSQLTTWVGTQTLRMQHIYLGQLYSGVN